MNPRLATAGQVSSRGLQRGMSLLEMVLVIALMAIIALITANAMGAGGEGRQLRSAVREVTTALRHARVQAIVQGNEQQFWIEPASGRWEGAKGRDGRVPDDLRVRFTGAAELQAGSGIGVIAFFPDGGSSGGRIELRGQRTGWQLDVNWITGHVKATALSRQQ